MSLKSLHAALALLTPYQVDTRKIRIGAASDGGYVMIDRFRPWQRVFSYGLSWNIAFERDLAERGHHVFMFDHTIEALTSEHSRFEWHKEGLAGETRCEDSLFSLEDHVARLAPSHTDMVLKLDVEGAEWAALAATPVGLLCRFEQVVIELHDLHRFGEEDWRATAVAGLGKLAQHFILHNVHGNNYAPLAIVDGVLPVPDVIEVSYIRSDLAERRPSSTLFPSHLDVPNDPLRPEMPLWYFPFLPVGDTKSAASTSGLFGDAARRSDETLFVAQATQKLGDRSKEFNVAQSLTGPLSALPPLSPGAPLKILCVSVHPVLEYDEIRLFESIGHQVFSLGFYFDRVNNSSLRGQMPETEWHAECRAAFQATGCSNVEGPVQWSVTSEFCARFDLVVVHHNYRFIEAAWESLRNSRVVWRTIGQEIHWAEDAMRDFRRRGVKIVRWSPEERHIERYIGSDAIIRAVKDPEDWTGWTGKTRRIVTFNNNFRARGAGMSFDFHQKCVENLPFDLFGLNNDDVPSWRGVVSAAQQQDILRSYCCAFLTGTQPAPYTLGFIEAWMTGIPVVHVGRRRSCGDAAGVYEIDRLIVHGENGFLVDEVDEAKDVMQALIDDPDLCKRISTAGRASAIEIFGKDRAEREWTDFLRDHITC